MTPSGKILAIADSDGVRVTSRMSAILGLPACLVALLGFVGPEFVKMRLSMERMDATIIEGIAPRIARLEETQKEIQAQIKIRTAFRFDEKDAKAMELRIQREIDRIQEEIVDLRRSQKRGPG